MNTQKIIQNQEHDLKDNKVARYILVLRPHVELHNKIVKMRKDLDVELGKRVTPLLFPSITLVSFSQNQATEEMVTRRFKMIASCQYPFKVELKDFDHDTDNAAIVIKVENKIQVRKMVKNIKLETKGILNSSKKEKPWFSMNPHVLLAYDLEPADFETTWSKYSKKKFTGRFFADGMLLYRLNEERRLWEVVSAFDFENLLAVNKKGELC